MFKRTATVPQKNTATIERGRRHRKLPPPKAIEPKIEDRQVEIPAPNFQILTLRLQGTAPLLISRFAGREEMEAKQKQGSVANSKKKREPRDFDKQFEDATYKLKNGKFGVNASSFRNAMISACRTVGFKMTHAKLAAFVKADGYDEDGTPLVVIEGVREKDIRRTRNATGVMDLRARPIWKEWSMTVRIEFDADMLSATDIINLMTRVGRQVGIGEGRPDSRASAGIGFGTFDVQREATSC